MKYEALTKQGLMLVEKCTVLIKGSIGPTNRLYHQASTYVGISSSTLILVASF